LNSRIYIRQESIGVDFKNGSQIDVVTLSGDFRRNFGSMGLYVLLLECSKQCKGRHEGSVS